MVMVGKDCKLNAEKNEQFELIEKKKSFICKCVIN